MRWSSSGAIFKLYHYLWVGRAYSHRIPLTRSKCMIPRWWEDFAARRRGEPGANRLPSRVLRCVQFRLEYPGVIARKQSNRACERPDGAPLSREPGPKNRSTFLAGAEIVCLMKQPGDRGARYSASPAWRNTF